MEGTATTNSYTQPPGHLSLSKEAHELQQLIDKDKRRQRQQDILTSLAKGRAVEHDNTDNEIPQVNEIASWMNNQTSVEQQLQQQVQFYQSALEKLKLKSEEIANENAKLYDQMRQNVVEQNIPGGEDSEDIEEYSLINKKPKERLLRTKNEQTGHKQLSMDEKRHMQQLNDNDNVNLNQMKMIYETKTNHLEGLLRATKTTIQHQEDEINKLKNEIKYFNTPVRENTDPGNGSTKPNIPSKANTKLVESLKREKEELLEGMKRLQVQLEEGKHREVEACHHVKKSCELVQQAHLEKQEALVHLKQTKTDLSEMHTKHSELKELSQNNKNKEIKRITQEHKKNIDGLNSKIEDQSITINTLEVQLDKVAREKVDLKTELEKEHVNVITQKNDAVIRVEECRKELLDAYKSKALVEQEINEIQINHRQKEKRKQQEIDKLTIESKEVSRRLQHMENNLRQHQVELLDVTNQSNALKLQLQTEKLQHNMIVQKYEDHKKSSHIEFEQKEQQLVLMLQEANRLCTNTKEELTHLLNVQTEIVNKYKDECQNLSTSLSQEKQTNREKYKTLKSKYEELETHFNMMIEKLREKENLIPVLEREINNQVVVQKDLEEQVLILVNKQHSLLRDRHLLTKEIELLRNQSKTLTLS